MGCFGGMRQKIADLLLSVPVRIKIIGIVLLPVLILGLSLNYWIQTGLSDWLSYLLSDERVAVAMQAGSRSVLLVTFLAAVASILLALLLTYILTSPLLVLNRTAQEVASGRLQSRVPIWSNDEIGAVAQSVNTMIDRLIATQENLAQANQRLEALNRVAMAAGRELHLTEVLDSILKGLLNLLSLEKGWAFILDPGSGRFYLAQQHGFSEAQLRSLQEYAGGEFCNCQKESLEEKADIQVRVQQACSRMDAVFNDSLHTHITIPLAARDQLFGLINLSCPRNYQISAENRELLSAIGAQASEIVANVWLHARLVEKEAARRYLLESLVRTQEDERYRLSRELHDGAGQILTGLLLRLKMLEKKVSPGELSEDIGILLKLVSDSIEQIRELSHSLRPAALEEFGLAFALENLVEDLFAGTGTLTKCSSQLVTSELPKEIETALYRIAQEALTNVLRHAQASHVRLELLTTPISICLRVEDDGCGFDVDAFPLDSPGKHLGLISIQERAEMLGGSLVVSSAPGEGTSIEVRIPLPVELVEKW